jgi:hypothetical protein
MQDTSLQGGGAPSKEFQLVALAFDILRTVTPCVTDNSDGEDADGVLELRQRCCEHIIAFLLKPDSASVWIPTK